MTTTATRFVTRQVEVEVPMFTPKGMSTEFEKTLPLVGDTQIRPMSQITERAVHCLVTNWDGDAERVFVNTKPHQLDQSWFTPNDKGSLSVFGLDAEGKVIFGMARYKGDPRAEDALDREDHYFIKTTNKASRFS
tara:strand:+ start:2864 stop:3268 length:405 start_codon:yes stop_codon:yes gene_type:complete